MRRIFALLVGAVAGLGAPAHANDEVYAAWTQVLGSAANGADVSGFVDLNLSLRVVITTDPDAACPQFAARITRGSVTRTEALRFDKRTNSPDAASRHPSPHTKFPVIVCETTPPADATSIALVKSVTDDTTAITFSQSQGKPVVLAGAASVGASGPPTFVAFGDTGCRGFRSHRGVQDCDSANMSDKNITQFMFKKVTELAAAERPEFVVHLGDYRYDDERKQKTMDMWDSDFFERVRLGLLAQAPWVFVRGNHEDCSLAGLGWFYFFAPSEGNCSGTGMSDTFYFDVADRSAGMQDPHRFIVIDTTASWGSHSNRHQAAMTDMAAAVTAANTVNWGAAGPSAWFLMHKPLWAVDDYPNPPAQADPFTGSLLRAVMSRNGPAACKAYDHTTCGLKAVLAAHLHIFQNAITPQAALPQQIVVGNSGVRMDPTIKSGRIDDRYVFEGCTQGVDPLGFGTGRMQTVVLNAQGRDDVRDANGYVTSRIDNKSFGFVHFTRDTSVVPSGWAGVAHFTGRPSQPLKTLADLGTGYVACEHN
ncbi:metallophosphoesterase [Tateyamaria sp. SN6-1]|uniref:metallophosphoesterase n=1 Tax=Tateyamaria sp. SN6-1 TaxID=3092148 RepID=UPI0039F5FAF3